MVDVFLKKNAFFEVYSTLDILRVIIVHEVEVSMIHKEIRPSLSGFLGWSHDKISYASIESHDFLVIFQVGFCATSRWKKISLEFSSPVKGSS